MERLVTGPQGRKLDLRPLDPSLELVKKQESTSSDEEVPSGLDVMEIRSLLNPIIQCKHRVIVGMSWEDQTRAAHLPSESRLPRHPKTSVTVFDLFLLGLSFRRT